MRKVAGAFLLAVVLSMVWLLMPTSEPIPETDVLTTVMADFDQPATQLADVAVEVNHVVQLFYSDRVVAADRVEWIPLLLVLETTRNSGVDGFHSKLIRIGESVWRPQTRYGFRT